VLHLGLQEQLSLRSWQQRVRSLGDRPAVVGLLTFAGAVAGLVVANLLPPQSLVEAKPIIASVTSLIAGLLALVLGLLVWTSHGVFVNQQSEVYALGAAINRLIFFLRILGPKGSASLAILKDEACDIRLRYWAKNGVPVLYNYEMSRKDMARLELSLAELRPEGDQEKRIVAACLELGARIIDSQLLMTRQLRNPTPTLLLDIVTAWATALFFGFGCLSMLSTTSRIAAAIGSAAVAAAAFLVLELEQPYAGICVVTPSGIDALLKSLSEEVDDRH
jgi:hypothetical protein